jgi:protein-lysine N-methyltransferase EEF2KMT
MFTANGMFDNVHLRMTLTRGTKVTSSMNPRFNLYGCMLLVVAEWKPVGNAATYDNAVGISLVTASTRRNSPNCVDSKIHHCNMLNNSEYSIAYIMHHHYPPTPLSLRTPLQ